MTGRARLGLFAALLVFLADQASKAYILGPLALEEVGRVDLFPTLSLTLVHNPGITFGLMHFAPAWSHSLLIVVELGIVVALAAWLLRAETWLAAVAVGAIAGGAVGNILDRARLGYVVDFIHFHVGGWSWYVFNVADAAIVCGVCALLLSGLRRPSPAPLAPPATPGIGPRP